MEALRSIGLSEGEIKVYEALLDLGNSPMSMIHERTGIERRNIYDIIGKLIERGLVTYVTENRRRLFQISHPRMISAYVDEKISALKRTKNEIESDMEMMEKRFNATRPSVDARIYRGSEGIKAAWDDMLNAKDIWWLGSGGYVPRQLPHFFVGWNRRRIERKVRQRHLYREEYRGKIVKMGKYVSVRFLPEEFSGNPVAVCIWGDKVGNFMLGEELFAFVIESEEIADNYRRYHEYLWENVAKP